MTPADVAARLGISRSLLCAWERQVGWPQPRRVGGARVYSDADVRDLERVRAWQRQGWTLAQLVQGGVLVGPPRPRCRGPREILARMRFADPIVEDIRVAITEGLPWRLPGLRAMIEARAHPRARATAWRLLRLGERLSRRRDRGGPRSGTAGG
jgi:hypothetical protein